MTHSIDSPLPPPTTGAATGTPSTSGATGTPSGGNKATETRDAALGEARNVGETAKQAGSQVKDQVDSQQQKAGQSLTSLAQELRSLANGTSQGAPGPARDLLEQASSSVENFASMLQNREPAQLLDDVRSFARRKPGLFLLGAAAAGVLAGRLTSGVKAAHSDSGSSGNGTAGLAGTTTNYVDPMPSYSETTSTYTGTGSAYSTAGSAAPLPPPPYGTVPPEGSMVPPTTPAGWDNPARPGGVG